MKKLLFLVVLLPFLAKSQTVITGKYKYTDSLTFAKYKNNSTLDSVLSVDMNGRLRLTTKTPLDTTSLSNRIDARVKYTDTASMLMPYLRKLDTTGKWLAVGYLPYLVKYSDTAAFLSAYYNKTAIDSKLALKVNISDTSSMLSNYYNKTATDAQLALKLNISDTANMLSAYYNKTATDAKVNLKVNISDTANMLSNYRTNINSLINDSAYQASQIALRVKYTDTSGMLSPYALSSNVNAGLATKVNISDTATMLSNYRTNINSLINDSAYQAAQLLLRVRYTDTALMLSPYLRSASYSPMVYPPTGIPYSTGLAWGSSYSTTGTGSTLALQTNALLLTPTLSGAVVDNTSPYIDWTGTSTYPTALSGRLFYDNINDALTFLNGNNGNNDTHLGQEVQFRVYNQTGATITAGNMVYITGQHSHFPTVALAQANSAATANAIGVTNTDIPNGAYGYVVALGKYTGIATGGLVEGGTIYLSATVAGGITQTAPTSPNLPVILGYVGYANSSASQGVIIMTMPLPPTLTSNLVGTITNSQLANSAITIQGTSTALGGSVNVINGTGFVKASGTTISYDNSTYLTTSSAASTYVPYTGATSSVNLGTNNLTVGSGAAGAGAHIDIFGDLSTAYVNAETAGGKLAMNPNTLKYTSKQFGGTKALYVSTNAVTGNDYVISFPDASGTVALTSDLSNYVTLTGTSQTISSAKTFSTFPTTFKEIKIDGSGTSASGVNLKTSSGGVSYAGTGYMTIYSGTAKNISILDGTSTSTAQLDFSSLTSGITRAYTYPDASGTIALTSNLSSYLPLSGGTLTGTLAVNGSSAILSLQNTSGNGKIWNTHSDSDGTLNINLNGTGYGLRIDTNYKVSFAGTLSNGTYTYTLPSATGTLALTSDLSSYLTTSSAASTYQTILTNPVTGTGVSGRIPFFNGTTTQSSSANLSWDNTNNFVATSGVYVSNNVSNAYMLTTTGDNIGSIFASSNTKWSLGYGTSSTTQGTAALSWDNTGKITFAGLLSNGTYNYTLPSATGTLALTSNLSSYLPLSGGTLTGGLIGTSASFSSNISYGGGYSLYPRGSTVTDWYLGKYITSPETINNSIGSVGSNIFQIGYDNSGTFVPTIKLYAGGNINAGAATFSSSVTATNAILSGGLSELTNSNNNDFKLTNSGTFRVVNNAYTMAVITATNSGLVGIGSSPLSGTGSYLQVEQSGSPNTVAIRRGDASNTGSSRILFQAYNASSVLQNTGIVEAGLDNSTTNGYLGFYAGTATMNMKITSGGNVTIGQASLFSSADKLTINTATAGDVHLRFQSAGYTGGSSYMFYNAQSGEFRIAQNDGGVGIAFWTGSTSSEKARINASGNFLVGTQIDGGYKFQVNGTSYFSNNISYSDGSAIYPRTTTVNDWYMLQHNASLDRMETAMGLNHDFTIGNYASGTYTPNIYLNGNGNAKFNGTITTGSGPTIKFVNNLSGQSICTGCGSTILQIEVNGTTKYIQVYNSLN